MLLYDLPGHLLINAEVLVNEFIAHISSKSIIGPS
jgi:hypothetical protein